MIDKMLRCKHLTAHDHIGSLNEWFIKCPPEGKEKHWKDGRSAKETAKHWTYTIPQEFKKILKPFNLNFLMCSPEFVTFFDKNGGNGRNHDLLIIAENNTKEKVLITIESKADESFADTISDTIIKAEKRLKEKPSSNGVKRIVELRHAIFGNKNDDERSLRYQLLTAVAGTIAEAKKQNSKKAIFLIQTFVSDEIDEKKHQKNQNDLNRFVEYLTHGKHPQIEEGELVGPIRVPGNDFIPNNIELWIGKYQIEI